MIYIDEEALICDLAETYQIYDYKQLPLSKVAVFSCGLREDSRIKMKMSNQTVSFETLLLAGISDKLSVLLWTKTKDAEKGKNLPKMIMDGLLPYKKEMSTADTSIFDSSEDFERRRNELIKQFDGGGM
ncbi:hypothetical protein F6X86_13560 [Enterococcus durans]|uniref:Phage protein n=1 Tax=Enterococcus durans TaxID=53345 RepID=A0A5N0YKN9_9ENTE|nr:MULTISPECIES: DUF5361 domain-containing protein [Enterococcus]KAA9176723.1 hypothetical protein F6X86_13560 [Enterococcus durans]KAA9182449.1 hypothetical protein F6X85_13570 [Enterococcus durans]KAA9187918.1 hypothetical protein F6X90_03345 [Enterococcus durans]KAA9187952.1 hypothetical protein F6Y12_13690 [Enterococcus durans]KAA9190232.1 hypothetical protein F6X88_13465 [Enterococcus durans]